MSKIDPVIYKLAGDLRDTVRAEAIIESRENPDAPRGDGGQARGLYQIHPGTWGDYYPFAGITTSDTWEEADTKLVAAYYRRHASTAFDLVVQSYNKGWRAVIIEGVRAPEYLARFDAALNFIRGERKTPNVD